jgi:NAD(P)-dependent dehydrogenase (short-subunit alcohol dehydrogenase family)
MPARTGKTTALEAFSLEGRTALVTGASRGIGRAIALAFAEAGAAVALAARDVAALDDLAGRVRGAGGRAVVIGCDVTDPVQVERMAATAIAELGGLDVVVNNAGGADHVGPFTDLTPRDWSSTMAVNLDGTVLVCRALAGHLLERGSGSVINVVSVAGTAGLPMAAHYAAAKSAVISLSQTLAVEWAGRGVRVNALAPGWTDTDLTRVFTADRGVSDALVAAVPADRWATPSDITGPALFLASDASAFITGHCLMVDGGWSADVAGAGLRALMAHGRIPL